jgi:hypothetical protein
LLFVNYYFLVMPTVTLLGWVALLVYDQLKDDGSVKGPLCVLLAGLGFLITGYNVLKIRWTNYRVKATNFALILVSVLCITLYQFVIIFGYEHEEKFFPYSALFLNFNVVLLGILLYLAKYTGTKDASHVIKKFFPETGDVFDPERDADLFKELDEQAEDEDYVPCEEDLKDIITASRVSKDKYDHIVGIGLIQKFNMLPAKKQTAIKAAILVLAYAVLAVYALVLYLVDEKNKLGIITSISVVILDLFNGLMYSSSMVDSPAQVVFLLIVNRVMMVALG